MVILLFKYYNMLLSLQQKKKEHRYPYLIFLKSIRLKYYMLSCLLWYHESNKGQTKNEVSIIIFTFACYTFEIAVNYRGQNISVQTEISRGVSTLYGRHLQYNIAYTFMFLYIYKPYTNIQWNIDSQTRVVAARSPDDSYLYKSTHTLSHIYCTHEHTYGRSWPYGNAMYLASGPGETVCEFITAAINYCIMST